MSSTTPQRVPDVFLEDLDQMVSEGYRGARNRTDLLRDALVPFIAEWKAQRAAAAAAANA